MGTFSFTLPHLIFRSLLERDVTTPILHVHDMMTKPFYTGSTAGSCPLNKVRSSSMESQPGGLHLSSGEISAAVLLWPCLFPMLDLNLFLPFSTGTSVKY